MPPRPRLLISVQNPDEARTALTSGADLIDVKDPERGALGMATLTAIQAVRDVVAQVNPAIPLSAACGEVIDWIGLDHQESSREYRNTVGSHTPVKGATSSGKAALERRTTLPTGLTFAKLGLSGLRNRQEWQHAWETVRRELTTDATPVGQRRQRGRGDAGNRGDRGDRGDQAHPCIPPSPASPRPLPSPGPSSPLNQPGGRASEVNWVAVAYVDEEQAQAPPVDDVIHFAAESRCRGVLFDTYSKQSGTFFDWMNDNRLAGLLEQIHARGLFCAAAGRLRPDDVTRLMRFPVDVIAVRSAACRAGNRHAPLCPQAISELQRRMHDGTV